MEVVESEEIKEIRKNSQSWLWWGLAPAKVRTAVERCLQEIDNLYDFARELIEENKKPLKQRVKEIHADMKGFAATFDHPLNQALIRTMVDAFKIGGAENYMALSVEDPQDNEKYEVLIQKKSGKTPADINAELKVDLAKLQENFKLVAESHHSEGQQFLKFDEKEFLEEEITALEEENEELEERFRVNDKVRVEEYERQQKEIDKLTDSNGWFRKELLGLEKVSKEIISRNVKNIVELERKYEASKKALNGVRAELAVAKEKIKAQESELARPPVIYDF